MYLIGFGKDIHKLVPSRDLILGGVKIPAPVGEEAHSDGDVLLHALMDAILGALNMGDIGVLFPNHDETYKDKSSLELLKQVVSIMQEKHYEIVNIDVHITLEAPKIQPYLSLMKAKIAPILGTTTEVISIKAGTNEGIGALGRCEAVEASAIVLLKRR
ncbi:MAG: 2-C-methyl-D-erythritol 2,4-cyclodiphosphate synthase [Erysipelotrichaceae bacterium]|nr:2-C-methyl-D-erythritol 2,4-cyclodiphosphate synthase [Erysipelotrichaceae bacterium]